MQDSSGNQDFEFDHVISPGMAQSEIFALVGKPTVCDVMAGYNGTIFAYGQTGSGKTYTMMGNADCEENFGIIPRTSQEIFKVIETDCEDTEFILKCSMLEIYKDSLIDLLDNKSNNLKIKQSPLRGIYVQGLSTVCVTNSNELLEIVALGEEVRTVASTRINASSSRSHLLLILEVTQKFPNGSEKKGVLNLVDLAGSEKIRLSGVTGVNLEEAKKINLSLSALGKVINALVVGQDHIPFRDSKLTRLLQESLGGNYKTTLIVNCSPAKIVREETLNSLQFAVRAKAIKNKVRVNIKESAEGYLKIIENLRGELALARQEIAGLKEKSFSAALSGPQTAKSRRNMSSLTIPKGNDWKLALESPLTANVGRLTPASSEFSMYDKRGFGHDTASNTFSCYSPDKQPEESNNFKETLEDYVDYKRNLRDVENELRQSIEKIQFLETQLKQKSEKILETEKKSLEYYTLYHKTLNLINKDSAENSSLLKKNELLSKTITQLSISLQNLEKCHFQIANSLKSPNTTNIEFADSEDHSNFPLETQLDEFFDTSGFELTIKKMPIDPEVLITSNPYGQRLKNALEGNNALSKDIYIFQLKSQVTQAGIINSNMRWTMENMNWKILFLKKQLQIKQIQMSQQKNLISGLEKMLEFAYKASSQLGKLSEKNDFVTPARKSKILRSFNSRSGKKGFETTDKSFGSSFLVPSMDFDGDSFNGKVKTLETTANLHQMYNSHLKKALENAVKEAEESRSALEKNLSAMWNSFAGEKAKWTRFYQETKENCELELVRKQEEYKKINEILAEWINNFIEIQDGLITKEKHRKLQELIITTINSYSPTEKINKIYENAPLSLT